MKLWKKLLIWGSLSLVLQLTILLYIDSVYLEKRGEMVEVSAYGENVIKPVSITLKSLEDISDLSVSHDCSYVAYLTDGDLMILNLSGEGEVRRIHKVAKKIRYFRWLPDRNMIIYAFHEEISGQPVINIETYETGTDVTRDYPKIKLNKKADIFKIEPSTLTNTVYVIIETDQDTNTIYKYDIVENLTHVTEIQDVTGIFHLIHTDNLIYQNGLGNIFRIDGKGEVDGIDLNLTEKRILLGTDMKGNMYIGNLDENQNIRRISFGEIVDSFENGSGEFRLEIPALAKNIHITGEGRMFQVSDNEKKIINLSDGTVTGYLGDFVQVAGKYIVSVEERKLRFKELSTLK